MTPKQVAHEFFLGIRTALTCAEVSVAEYEGVMAYKIEVAIKKTIEQCKDIYRQKHSGGCRMYSEGHACDCFLCQVDEILK